MKTLTLILLLNAALFAADVDRFAREMGYHRSYTAASAQAVEQHKLIMLVMVADYCPWCRKLERRTLKSEAVAAKVRAEFVPIIVDRNYDRDHYPAQYDVPRIPTIFFVDPATGNHIFESIAYVRKNDFLATLDDVLTTYKAKP